MVINGINFPLDRITALARAVRVRRLYLFGSILTDRFRPDSDIDILVETDPADPPGLFALGGLQMDLTQLLGRDVHLTLLGGVPMDVRESLISNSRLLDAA